MQVLAVEKKKIQLTILVSIRVVDVKPERVRD